MLVDELVGEGDVVFVDEVFEVAEAIEAVLEGIGGGAELSRGAAWAGGFPGVSAVGGEGGFGHGLLAGLRGGRVNNFV